MLLVVPGSAQSATPGALEGIPTAWGSPPHRYRVFRNFQKFGENPHVAKSNISATTGRLVYTVVFILTKGSSVQRSGPLLEDLRVACSGLFTIAADLVDFLDLRCRLEARHGSGYPPYCS